MLFVRTCFVVHEKPESCIKKFQSSSPAETLETLSTRNCFCVYCCCPFKKWKMMAGIKKPNDHYITLLLLLHEPPRISSSSSLSTMRRHMHFSVVTSVALTLIHLDIWVIAASSLHLLDKISALPGQPHVEFQHYSGYVTVDSKKRRALFYYFVEAEADADPLSKPLVLWLNGGPGCSSLGVGAFSENGPFRANGDALVKNENSWNKEANMLYLETPVGVGFSYSTNPEAYKKVNDVITARDNLVFLRRWLVKFPRYKNTSLFLTGESYAGHYVPQLAQLILQYNNNDKNKRAVFNLKGIALGNPVLEFAADLNSRAEFLWSHGLISDSTYIAFTADCNYSRYVSEYYRGRISPTCWNVMSRVTRETSRFVDKYDVTLDVCLSSVFLQSKLLNPKPQEVGGTVDVCLENETENYLNRVDVQKAFHARLLGVSKWVVCSTVLDYELLDLEKPTITLLPQLIRAGISVMVYSGDQDSVIPLTGSRRLVHGLAEELGLNTTVPYRVWFEGQQVGGWTQVYGSSLSFATIRGASHEAPFSQPKRSYVLFKSFLEGVPLPESF